ncbi:hypothetical protein LX97_00008 [Nonlabens dokdonensis]|jgi:hypothetical protein|uniref:Uncharacterized protein n=2 Tax=Nonlabens dokdonensis TaxID=328515 RepID=L7W1G8_NONDD|nr:winged helix-turn-helix domain-containing protein [Nonlabens dokdonensis]AGC75300.1 hypothetical protein DDD_0173 [Nonlabens dokdonensis DSW-6]PZX43011.1 hypothetical protein LX97_00008 [Nonlabens dokdonensis]
MFIIPYSESLKALDTYIKNYNSQCTSVAEKLKQSTISTAKDLIRIYGLELLKIKYNPLMPLPPLRTNNKHLATISNTSGRTIQRHIKRLQRAGIITHKKWRGSRASYDIHILTEILCITKAKPVENLNPDRNKSNKVVIDNQVIAKNKTTICPHRDTSNNGYINNIIIAVDKWKTDTSSLPLTLSSKSRNATGNSFTRYTGEIAPKKYKNAGETARNTRVTEQTGAEILESDVARSVSLSFYVNALWKLARNTIYKEHYLTKSQEKKAKELLFKWYDPVPDKKLADVHQVYVERLGIVQKYIAKDPKSRYVQLPDKYFNPDNPSGFTGTRAWYYQQKKRELNVQMKLILHSQIRRFLNNEKKETAKQQPRLALFKACETRLGKLGQPHLVREFHASVLNHSTHKFLQFNT